jgi:hypothetical protein
MQHKAGTRKYFGTVREIRILEICVRNDRAFCKLRRSKKSFLEHGHPLPSMNVTEKPGLGSGSQALRLRSERGIAAGAVLRAKNVALFADFA